MKTSTGIFFIAIVAFSFPFFGSSQTTSFTNKVVISNGSNVMSLGQWDGVYNRIESEEPRENTSAFIEKDRRTDPLYSWPGTKDIET